MAGLVSTPGRVCGGSYLDFRDAEHHQAAAQHDARALQAALLRLGPQSRELPLSGREHGEQKDSRRPGGHHRIRQRPLGLGWQEVILPCGHGPFWPTLFVICQDHVHFPYRTLVRIKLQVKHKKRDTLWWFGFLEAKVSSKYIIFTEPLKSGELSMTRKTQTLIEKRVISWVAMGEGTGEASAVMAPKQ